MRSGENRKSTILISYTVQLAQIGTLKRLSRTAVMRMRLWKYLVTANVVALATTKKEVTQPSVIYRIPCNVVQRGWLEK